MVESGSNKEFGRSLRTMTNMRILTWNINGIRSRKEPLKQILDELNADIICFQETKVTRDQLDELSAIVEGYNSYFSFSKVRSGYSGVATFVKDTCTPVKAEEGLSGNLSGENSIGNYGDQSDFSEEELHALDNEGRAVITQHEYRADPENEDRKIFKLRFYALLQLRAECLYDNGSNVIVLGDVNTSHKLIDHCNPDEKEFYKNPGRHWLKCFLNEKILLSREETSEAALTTSSPGRFVDTFRYFHPTREKAFTCWSTVTGARATNYGTRIDYIFVDESLCSLLGDCDIHPDVEGSDHCPVSASLKVDIVPARRPPVLCSRYLPEFAGRQQKLSSFFSLQSSGDGFSGTGEPLSKRTIMSTAHPTKREGEELKSNIPRKAKKDNKKPSVSKQGSLLSFFKQPKSNATQPVAEDNQQSVGQKETKGGTFTAATFNKSKNPHAAKSWKTLLKGPPSAPLCKGHNESCVLRVVKKDNLNKGRQFWVCNRPEGHKTNPEARCEHFEWIEKSRKSVSN